jgi:hypothetical protein
MRGEPILRGPDDAAPRACRQRPSGILEALAPLHLDEGEPLTLERNEVDLSDRGLVALRDDAVAFEAKEKARKRLREQPAAIGFARFRFMARRARP